jgi:hypothetical protein
MKSKLLILTLIFAYTWHGNAQVLSLGPGQMFYNSKTIVPVVNQYEEKDNRPYYSFDFTLPSIGRYLPGLELSMYAGWVDFNAPGETFAGFGSSRTTLFRISPSLGYRLLPNHKFDCIPYFKIVMEQSIFTGLTKGRSVVAAIEEPGGYTGTIFVEPIARFQVMPAAGLMLSWNPIGPLYLRGNIYYSYGYRPFQKYFFEYNYQGVDYRTAEWHANGTGVFTSIGLGVRLWKAKGDR